MTDKNENQSRKIPDRLVIKRFQERQSLTPRSFGKMVSEISNLIVRPNFQRKRVWSLDAIKDLWSTYARGGCINSGILLWKITLGSCGCYQYKLPSKVDTSLEGFDFEKIDIEAQTEESLNQTRYSLIDGQQKAIATLLLFNNFGTWDGGVFCMNLMGLNKDNFDDYDKDLDVKVIYEDEIESENNKSIKNYYIRTCRIASMTQEEIEDFVPESEPLLNLKDSDPDKYNKIVEDMRDILFECNYHINNDYTLNINYLINYDYDSAYNEFVKANVTGKALSKEDLIFGKIEGTFPGFRESLENFRKECGFRKKKASLSPYQASFNSYSLKTEDILYTILYLCGLGFGPEYTDISLDDIENLKKNFKDIKRSIVETFRMLATININARNCESYNAINTIILYRYENNKDFSDSDKKNIWLYLMWVSFIDFFGRGHTTNILNSFRKFYISNESELKKKGFNLEFVLKKWDHKDEAQHNFLNLSENKIKEMVRELNYEDLSRVRGFFCLIFHFINDNETFGWRAMDQIDHMQPQSLFIKPNSYNKLVSLGVDPQDAASWADPKGAFCNRIGNLHVLDERMNKRKGDDLFEIYLNKLSPRDRALLEACNIQYIEGIDYTIVNWASVVEARERFMTDTIISNWINVLPNEF